jgi:hypothetical protein
MKIKVYANLNKEVMYQIGLHSGLSEQASNYLRYFEEICVTLDVEEETGIVKGAEVTHIFENKDKGK